MVLTLPYHPRRSTDEQHARQVAFVVALAAHLFFAVWLLRDWHRPTLQPEAPGMVLVDVHPAPARVASEPQLRRRYGAARATSSRTPVNEGSLASTALATTQAGSGMGAEETVSGGHPAIAAAFRPPIVLHRVTTAYPDDARRAGREGETELLVTIAADGSLRDTNVSVSSGDESLDRAALAAVRRYTFHAAEKGGLAIEAQAYVDVAWKITPALAYGPVTTLPQDTRMLDVVESKNGLAARIDGRDSESARGPRSLDARAERTPRHDQR